MSNPVIKVKRSSVAGKVPQSTQLERGELAVNSYDGKVYIVRDQFSTGIGTTTHTINPWDEYTIGSKIAYAGIASAQQFDGNITGSVKSSGVSTFSSASFSKVITATHGITGNINSAGISTISGFTFPSTDGTEDQALVTDGSGSLSFKTLSGGGGATGAATTISTGLTTATAGQTTFTAPNVFDDGSQATAFSTQVFLNGVKMRLGASNDYQLSAPQTVTFNSGVPQAKDEVTIVVYFGHTLEEEFFTATEGQKDFTLSGSLASSKNYKAYLNGVRLRNTVDYTASSAVVLTQSTNAGDQIDIVSDQAEDRLTAVQNQTSFAPSDSNTTSDNMQVYLNGVLLRETEDWSIGNPSVTILDADGLTAGDHLDVVVRRS